MPRAYNLVVAVFDTSAMAESAIHDLKNTGFSNDEIRYASRQERGGLFENLKEWITEETATIGDVAKNLKDLGVPESSANYYAQEHDAGRPIVAVRCPGHDQDAMNVLKRHGGYSHHVASGSTTVGMGPATQPSPAFDQPIASRDRPVEAEEVPILLREEPLHVEKQRGRKGEGEVREDVVIEQQGIDVPVSHEEIVRKQTPVSEVRPADTPRGQGEARRIPLGEEPVNVTKQSGETGEVDMTKRKVQGEQRVRDTIRREKPRIEQSGDVYIRRDEDRRQGPHSAVWKTLLGIGMIALFACFVKLWQLRRSRMKNGCSSKVRPDSSFPSPLLRNVGRQGKMKIEDKAEKMRI